VACGEPNPKLLTLDHIANNGKEHRKEVGSTYVYPWLRSRGFPKGFQVLCQSCNMKKQFNRGVLDLSHPDYGRIKVFRALPLHQEALHV
jgi:hypothetical protein